MDIKWYIDNYEKSVFKIFHFDYFHRFFLLDFQNYFHKIFLNFLTQDNFFQNFLRK